MQTLPSIISLAILFIIYLALSEAVKALGL